MGEKLIAFWHWIATSRYTLFLESERERLIEENRGLVNSMLTRAGMPSIGPYVSKPQKPIQGRMMPSQIRRKWEAASLEKNKEQAQ